MQPETLNRSIQPTPTVHPRGFTPTCVQYWKAANSKSQPTLWGRAPAEFAGGGLAPRPSCRCVLSRAPHEGHMAAGSC